MKYILYSGSDIETIYSTLEKAIIAGHNNLPTLTDDEIESQQRVWRNQELKNTDWIVPISDHPQRAAYITYRANLRGWPATEDFPDTKPTL